MAEHDEDEEIPNAVPLLGFDENDEPYIVRSQVIRPSPLPFWLAVVIVIMAALTLAQGVWYQSQRDADARCAQARNDIIAQAILDRQDASDADRKRLKLFIEEVLQIKDAAQYRKTLENFVAEEDAVQKQLDANKRDIAEALRLSCKKGDGQ